MRHAPKPLAVCAQVLLALVIALAATACGGATKAASPPAPSASAAATDPEVGAVGLPDGTKIDVTDSSPADEVGDNLDFVSPIYTVSSIGPLDQAATFTIQLDNALPSSATILVATRPYKSSAWSWQHGRLTDDHLHVRFNDFTLDQVGVVSLDRAGALPSLRSDVRRGLFPTLRTKAVKPTCQGSAAALEDGYDNRATNRGTLYWCFGLVDKLRVVTITNRRAIPVAVVHTGMKVVVADPTPRAYAAWTTVLGKTSTVLAPGGSATYDAELASKGHVKVVAASTKQTQALRLLQAASSAFATKLDDFGVGPVRAAPALDAFLAAPACLAAVRVGVDDVIQRCFSARLLSKAFGSRGLLLEPLLAGRSFPAFLGQQGNRLSTRAKDQREVVYVDRVAPDFTGLVGLWSGPTRTLSIDAKGLTTETLDADGTLVIQLTYQLADPVTKDGTTTAGATLTTVKVGNRKMLNGALPQVGGAGTITLRKGVITPPYLMTTYCNAAANRSGSCGT